MEREIKVWFQYFGNYFKKFVSCLGRWTGAATLTTHVRASQTLSFPKDFLSGRAACGEPETGVRNKTKVRTS